MDRKKAAFRSGQMQEANKIEGKWDAKRVDMAVVREVEATVRGLSDLGETRISSIEVEYSHRGV